jgi:hypothetical protein
LKKYGLDSTAKRYFEHYAGYKYSDSEKYQPPFQKIVLEKIEFVGMVKGRHSALYRELLRKFAYLASDYVKPANLGETLPVEVLIYTEGKTDGKHLNAGLRHYQSQKMFRHISVTCLDNKGFDDLEKRLDFTLGSPEKHTKPHVFIFDRDISKTLSQKVAGNEQYKPWGKGVYSLVIPLPKHREQTPEISIEFYYKDDDLTRKDKNGRRLFVNTEFDKTTGQHLMEELNCALLNKLGNPIKIIDEKVFNRQRQNVALSKDEFAENILGQTEEFSNIDFSGFVPLLEVISTIVADFNGEVGQSA